jgi:hypothetical protein
VFWVQPRLPGRVLDDHGRMVARLLPDLLRLNDAQAGLGRAITADIGP